VIELQFIYALFSGQEDFFYVGRSGDPKRRLKEHLLEADPMGTAKQKKLWQLQEAGIPIELKILQSGLSSKLGNAEHTWIINLRAKGYDLTNGTGGSEALLEFEPSGIVTPWDVSLFQYAEWQKGDARSKTGEKSCWIKGVQFHRLGQKKLRLIHADFGNWQVEAFPDMNARYERVCLMLTVGTPENEFFVQQYQQVQRFKGIA
jgi:hypothetical protein